MKKYQFLFAVLSIFLFVPLVPSIAFADVGGGGGGGGGALCTTTGGTTLCSSYSQSINLSPGWNTVSTPRILLTHSFSAAETSANFDIYVLDASQTSGWATMSQEGQTEFTPLAGYFIDNKTGANQTLTFTYLANTTPNQQLFSKTFTTPGWYSIGIANPTYALPVGTASSVDTNNPAKILNALSGFYNTAVDFTDSLFSTNPDAVSVGSAWKAVVPSDINTLNDFRETKGYALYLSQANGTYNGFQNSNIPAPVITSFAATPASIVNGSSATLSWSVAGATTLSIDQGVGTVTGNSTSTSPSSSTTYMLTATNSGGSSTSSATVTVTAVPMPASLTVANGSSPVSQTIIAGGQNIQFATIQLDASQSGENVRLSSIPVTITTADSNGPSYLSACQIWNGTTALNTGSRVINSANITGTSPSFAANFSFDNALVVPKGTVLSLSVMCNLSSTATAAEKYTFAAATTGWSVTGSVSGTTVTIATPIGTAPTMSVSAGATLVGSTDSSSPAFAIMAGGATGVTTNVIKMHAASEAVNLQKVGFKLTGNASDVTQAYIYAGNNIKTTSGTTLAAGTLLGTIVFTGSNVYATSTLSTVAQLPADTDATLIIKADLASIGTNKAGTEGDLVAINYDSSRGVGANSGKTVDGTGTGATSSGVRMFASFPTFAAGPAAPANPNGSNQVLKRFSITANSSGSIGIWQITINVATSSVTLGNLQLHAYTDSGYSSLANVPGSASGQFGTTDAQYATDAALISAPALAFNQSTNAPLEVGANLTVYFTLTGNILTIASGANNWTVAATVQGDTQNYAGVTNEATIVGLPSNFIWSPNSTSTATIAGVGSGDWTNGYGVAGLPSTGL